MKTSHYLKPILPVVLAVSIAACGSSSGTSSSSSSDSSGTATATATAQTGSSRAAVNGAASNTASVAQQSGSGLASLIKAQRAARYLAAGEAAAVEADSVSFEESYDCDESGTMAFSGTQSYEIAEDFSTFSMSADSTVSFDNCTEDQIVEASDGSCLLTASMDGDIDQDFTFDMSIGDLEDESDDSFTMEATMFTDGITMTIYGDDDSESSVEVGFDLSMSMTGTDDDFTLTGTITIDGVEYDASEDIDSASYTMEELGCVQVEDEDGDGEEDAEPGEEGYDFEDEGTPFTLDLCEGTPAAADSVNADSISDLCACVEANTDDAPADCTTQVTEICDGLSTISECADAVSEVIESDSTDDTSSDDTSDDAGV